MDIYIAGREDRKRLMPDLKDELSVLLLVKGREEFTPRWLGFHSSVSLACAILVGDGAPDAQNEALVGDYQGRLNVTYLQYDDVDYHAFYRKMLDMVSRCQTPFVQLAANDDFILPTGAAKSVEFLTRNPDYVAASGAIYGFYVGDSGLRPSRGPYGSEMYRLLPLHPALRLGAADAFDRIECLFQNYVPTWYSIQRRQPLQQALEALVESKIKDPRFAEHFLAFYMAALGKQDLSFDRVSYLYQQNSSQVNAFLPNYFHGIIFDNLGADIKSLVDGVARIASAKTGRTDVDIGRVIGERVAAHLGSNAAAAKRSLMQIMAPYRHTARAKIPVLTRAAKEWEMRKLLRLLSAAGAGQTVLDGTKRELKAAFTAINRVR